MRTPEVHGRVLYFADKLVADFVAERIPDASFVDGTYVGLGVVLGGVLVGGVVFDNCSKYAMSVSIAADTPRWLGKETLNRLFSYPFRSHGCNVLRAIVHPDNHKSLELVRGLGFTQDGVIRAAFENNKEGYIFSLLREECKFLR